MNISAVVPTYGRYSLLRETVAFWLLQTHREKELVLVNSNPVPIVLDKSLDPRIRVVNTDLTTAGNLGDATNLAVASASTGSDLIQVWADDDWYLPWFMQISHDNFNPNADDAWKPSRSWFYSAGERKTHLSVNNYECGITFRATDIQKWQFPPLAGDAHASYVANLVARKRLGQAELGWQSPYVFLWNNNSHHISGSVGNKLTAAQNSQSFFDRNTDHGNRVPLTPDWHMAKERFKLLHLACRAELSKDDWDRQFVALFKDPIGPQTFPQYE